MWADEIVGTKAATGAAIITATEVATYLGFIFVDLESDWTWESKQTKGEHGVTTSSLCLNEARLVHVEGS